VLADYSTYYHPERTRLLRDLLASKKWNEVYLIARQIREDMAQLVLLSQAEMAKGEYERLMGELTDQSLYMVD
jgi:hypothetical protein